LKKSSHAHRNRQATAVDDADVEEYLAKRRRSGGEDAADVAYDLALFTQEAKGMSSAYAKAFAERVRQRVLWMKKGSN